ncbi:hypothetical protein WOLCODRAFT_94781 [Wolfiporia cocos MD-104 SS10]|uniref:Uncharacterized protein n=1 Tax=Wolfiporia cocos (strain MD-104) TaxID=742152 RepID=A0A2H3J8U5_WOLCO|nr:hypothetical protein WOLCODRAFT_94781 [Wolfiporia cocos MD-104 SS10]
MTDPIKFSVRTLSERYGLSMQRVDAILRLQGLEEHWRKEKKQLQTGFLDGMEEILGVVDQQKSKADRHVSIQGAAELGEDTSMADAQMDGERSNRARERYQRLFWEPIAEGQDPAVLGALQRARHDELEKHRQVAEAKAAKADVPPIIHNEHVVERLGRPTLRFIDVGRLYVDVNDRIRRIKESERRSRLRARRRERKVQAIRRVVQTRASSKSEATSTAA